MDDKIKITNMAILAPMAAAVFVVGLLCGIAIAPENEPWTLPDSRVVSYNAATGCLTMPGLGNGGASTIRGGKSGSGSSFSGSHGGGGGGCSSPSGGGAGGPAPSSDARVEKGSGYCYSTGPNSAVCTYRLKIK